MDDCEKSLELISCMIDGELSKQEQELLYAHIANCSSCKNAYEAFSFISNELSENLDAPPPLLAGSIMSKINLEKQKKSRRPIVWLRYGAAAACFALILFGAARWGLLTDILGAKSAAPKAAARAEMAESNYIFDEAVGAAPENFDYPQPVDELSNDLEAEFFTEEVPTSNGNGEASLFGAPPQQNSAGAGFFFAQTDNSLMAVSELFSNVTEIRFYEGAYTTKEGLESTNKLLVTITDKTELKSLTDALLPKAAEPDSKNSSLVPAEVPQLTLLLVKTSPTTGEITEKLLAIYKIEGQIFCSVSDVSAEAQSVSLPLNYTSVSGADSFSKLLEKIKLAHSIR